MNLLEFQAKELLNRYDIATPVGRVTNNAEDAERIAQRLGFDRFVVKAQIGAGDRGNAGGVLPAATPQGVRASAQSLLAKPLVTSQTGPQGEQPRWILIEEWVLADELLYAAISLDRSAGQLRLLTSRAGGGDIEEKARHDPGIIHTCDLTLREGGADGCFAEAAAKLGLEGKAAERAARLLSNLGRAAVQLDATLVEINPLAVMSDGRLLALDAKMVVDDNALLRQPGLAALRAANQVESGDPEQLAADRHQLNYQRMDGDIGVVVNGAGLALATIDLLGDAGGKPANFMDVRTTATSLDVAYGFELIVGNPRVKVVLVNVHGGGMQRCDTVAEGVGIAMRRSRRSLPLVVRFAGNNADFAVTRLKSYGIDFEQASDMADAVARAVRLAQGRR